MFSLQKFRKEIMLGSCWRRNRCTILGVNKWTIERTLTCRQMNKMNTCMRGVLYAHCDSESANLESKLWHNLSSITNFLQSLSY
jgi:hypothetical protein